MAALADVNCPEERRLVKVFALRLSSKEFIVYLITHFAWKSQESFAELRIPCIVAGSGGLRPLELLRTRSGIGVLVNLFPNLSPKLNHSLLILVVVFR